MENNYKITPAESGGKFTIGGSGGFSSGGKGSGGDSTPSDDPDSLRSRQYAEVLFALSVGTIAGFGLSSATEKQAPYNVYLNGTPVVSKSGNINYKNTQLDWRLGTASQDRIPLYARQKREYPVGVTVKKDYPVVRTLQDDQISNVTVRIRFPSMLDATAKNGEVKQTRVQGRIQVIVGSVVRQTIPINVLGKSNSPYDKSYNISLPTSPTNSWDIKVIRDTEDSDNIKLQNDMVWSAFTSKENKGNAYLNTAILGIRIPSSQFPGNVPEVAADLRGVVVKIPHNYDPATRSYSGSFNGSLTLGYTNNPVWCLYDLLTDDVYGAGIPSSIIDVYSFYDAARYCDGTVQAEPRYTLNTYIDRTENAYDLINKICSNFRSNILYSNGKLQLVVDRPKTPTRLYSRTNVVTDYSEDGVEVPPFTYSGTDINTRVSACIVKFLNAEQGYIEDEAYYEDTAGIARYGYKVETIEAFGCTSAKQALRLAKWQVYTNLYQTEILTFKVASEGLLVNPGEIVKVADSHRAGSRLAGRIITSSTTSIKIDTPVNIITGATYVLSVIAPWNGQQIEVAINNPPGANDILTWSTPLPFTPLVDSQWMLTTPTQQPSLWQVLKVSEEDNQEYKLECVNYNASKFDFVEFDGPLIFPDTSSLPLISAPVACVNLQVIESLYETTGSAGVKSKAQVFWGHPAPETADKYQVEYNDQKGSGWKTAGVTSETFFDIPDLSKGFWAFRVKAINNLGLESPYLELLNKELLGLSRPPSDVVITGFSPIDNSRVRLSWQRSPDLDVRIGGYLEVRHTPKLSGVTQADGIIIGRADGQGTSVDLPLVNGTYICRFVDSSGNRSINPTLVETNFADLSSINVVRTLDEASPLFSGQGYNINIDPVLNIVKLGLKSDFDSWPVDNIDSITEDWDTYNSGLITSATYGEYYLSKQIDLGDVYTSLIRATVDASAFSKSNLFDKDTLFDNDKLFDGDSSRNNADATLQISVSNDLVNWSAYKDFIIGNYKGRAFRFRLVLESFDGGNTSILVRACSITVDMPDVLQNGTVTSSTSAGTVVTYPVAFHPDSIPNVRYSLNTGATGDYAIVSNITNTGFTINVYNSSGVRVARSVGWAASGFGRLSTATAISTGNAYFSSENGLLYFVSESGDLLVPETNVY